MAEARMKPGFISALGEWERMNVEQRHKARETLLPCPFCGTQGRHYGGHVRCPNSACGVEVSALNAEQWNTRNPCDAGLREADILRRLSSDVGGVFTLYEDGLRELIGNTNYAVIMQWVTEANSARETLRDDDSRTSGDSRPHDSAARHA